MTWLLGSGHRHGCSRTSFFPNSRFTWTWVCWDASQECLLPFSLSLPSSHFHGPAVVGQVHRRVPLDLDLIYYVPTIMLLTKVG